MRLAALTLVALAMFAAPAWAQTPPPTIVTFEGEEQTPITVGGARFTTVGECPASPVIGRGGRDGGAYLQLVCPDLHISFDRPQTIVELFVRDPAGDLTLRGYDLQGNELVSRTVVGTGWQPVVLAAPGIQYVERFVSATATEFALDDVAFSPVDQPDTTIAADGTTFTFSSSHPLVAGYYCKVDAAPSTLCANPLGGGGLGFGTHTLQARAVDVYGRIDGTPASTTFTIAPPPLPPPPPPEPDGDADGVPDARDNCPASANADQADEDADGVGNACEQLPSGNTPPTAGVTAVVKQLSGEVFVRLPRRSLQQESGFIPLKGVASLPVGTTVDARKGEIELESAANGFAAGDRRAKRQEARVKAGMFAIRQKRAKRRAAKKTAIATDVALLSPPGAETPCRRGPSKGIVRSVSMVAKGLFRAVAGASTATAKNATFATTDRCDGTLTEVGKGRVSLKLKGRKKPVTVRGGGAYFMKAKLFAARKGKRPIGL